MENLSINFDDLIESAELSNQKRFDAQLNSIEAAFAKGVKHQLILDRLNAEGFELTMKTYRNMLARSRSRRRREHGRGIEAPPPVDVVETAGPAVAGVFVPTPVPAAAITEVIRTSQTAVVRPPKRATPHEHNPGPKKLHHDLNNLPEW